MVPLARPSPLGRCVWGAGLPAASLGREANCGQHARLRRSAPVHCCPVWVWPLSSLCPFPSSDLVTPTFWQPGPRAGVPTVTKSRSTVLSRGLLPAAAWRPEPVPAGPSPWAWRTERLHRLQPPRPPPRGTAQHRGPVLTAVPAPPRDSTRGEWRGRRPGRGGPGGDAGPPAVPHPDGTPGAWLGGC